MTNTLGIILESAQKRYEEGLDSQLILIGVNDISFDNIRPWKRPEDRRVSVLVIPSSLLNELESLIVHENRFRDKLTLDNGYDNLVLLPNIITSLLKDADIYSNDLKGESNADTTK